MSTNVENRIKLARPREDIRQLDCLLPERLVLVQELGRQRIALEHLDGVGVQRSFTTVGRGDDQLGLVFEDGVGMGEFGLVVSYSPCQPGVVIRTKYHPVGPLLPGI